LDNDIADATPTPRIEPVEVGNELGPVGLEDQAGRPMTPVAQPVPHIPPAPQAQPEQSEQPKRRSTVREPAPVFLSGQGFTPSPRPEPTPSTANEQSAPPSEESSGDADKPRKTGWWAKRVFGEKG
jgi:ribonuclease E